MTALLLALLLAVNVQDTDERTLLRLEDDWASALVKRDGVTFERLLADGFVYTENDQIMDRRAVLNSRSVTLQRWHFECMCDLIARRSPQRIAQMERERCLC